MTHDALVELPGSIPRIEGRPLMRKVIVTEWIITLWLLAMGILLIRKAGPAITPVGQG